MTDYLHHLLFPGLLLAAAGTIGIFSLVFKENKLFRFFEHLFLGLAAGYSLQLTWTDVLRPMWWDAMIGQGQWAWIFVLPFGAMFYGIYTKRYAWYARMIFGIFFGLAAGTIFQGFSAEYMPQVAHSFKPIIPSGTLTVPHAIDNLLFVLILTCVVVYFFFAFEQNVKVVQRTALAGRWILMIAFGAIFGSTIMTREALLIDRVYFIVHDWLRIPTIGH